MSTEPSQPSARRDRLIRPVALLALVSGVVYLVWRIGWTHDGAQPVLYTVLLVAELSR